MRYPCLKTLLTLCLAVIITTVPAHAAEVLRESDAAEISAVTVETASAESEITVPDPSGDGERSVEEVTAAPVEGVKAETPETEAPAEPVVEETDEAIEPDESADPETPAEPAEEDSDKAEEPAEPETPAEPVVEETDEAIEPDESADPETPAEPAGEDADKTEDPAEPETPAEPAGEDADKIEDPAEPEIPAEPAGEDAEPTADPSVEGTTDAEPTAEPSSEAAADAEPTAELSTEDAADAGTTAELSTEDAADAGTTADPSAEGVSELAETVAVEVPAETVAVEVPAQTTAVVTETAVESAAVKAAAQTAAAKTAQAKQAKAVTAVTANAKQTLAKAAAKIKQMTLEVIDFNGKGYGDGQMLTSGGKRLLIDTYVKESWNTVNRWLTDHKYTSFDIYISHYHDDHMDNVTRILNSGKYKVSKLYLPDFKYMNGSSSYMTKYIDYCKNVINTAKKKGVEIVYLKKGSSFSVGDVNAKVLWGTDYKNSNHDLHYINNNSLLTRFTCGDTRYLNGGDIEAETERSILNAKVDVKADIFKLNHHGGNTSNTDAFLKAVNASFYYYNYCRDTQSKYAADSFSRSGPTTAAKYGNVASVRYNGNITYTVYDDIVTQELDRNYTVHKLYLYNKEDTKKLEGVVTEELNKKSAKRVDARACGDYSCSYSVKKGTHADGWVLGNTGYEYYYRNNKPLTGWKKIGNYLYHFNTKTAKKDTGWKKFGGNTFYFDGSGRMKTGFVKFGDGVHYFNKQGHEIRSKWLKVNGKTYYMNSKGVRQTGWMKKASKLYYFGSDGVMKTGSGFMKIGKKVFYVCKDGSMKMGWLKVNGKTYYMNADGTRQTGWLRKGSRRFYFGSDGVLRKIL